MSRGFIFAVSFVAFFIPALLVLEGLQSLDLHQVVSVAEHSVMWMVFLVRLSTGSDFYTALCFVITVAVICGLFFSCFVASFLFILFDKKRDDLVR